MPSCQSLGAVHACITQGTRPGHETVPQHAMLQSSQHAATAVHSTYSYIAVNVVQSRLNTRCTALNFVGVLN